MNKEEFMDRLFDTINEAKNIPVKDIIADMNENTLTVYLTDQTVYIIECKSQA